MEYIIIDGGSTDQTISIIEKYQENITYWVSEKDNGQSDAINKGLEKATGDIVNWLNSDDYYFPNTLSLVAAKFSESEHINCVVGRSRLFSGKETVGEHRTYIADNLVDTLRKPTIEQPSTFFSRKAIRQMGDLSEELHYCMDKEWWIKYLLKFGIEGVKVSDDFYVNFRHHDESKTISGTNPFYNDHANILYSILSKSGVYDYANILKIKYEIYDNYSFNGEIDSITSNELRRISFYFLLKQSRLIFAKKDFDFAKEVLKVSEEFSDDLNDEEIIYLEELKRKLKSKNWLIYRLRRRIKYIQK